MNDDEKILLTVDENGLVTGIVRPVFTADMFQVIVQEAVFTDDSRWGSERVALIANARLDEIVKERDELRAELGIVRALLQPAFDQCEAIALSSLLAPSGFDGIRYGSGGFYKMQATKSVGSGGRAYHTLKEVLDRIDKFLK